MSDNSDSDDSILQQAVFRKRRQSSTRNNNDSFLEKLVQTRQAETLTGLQVARLERETTEIRPLVKKERVAVEASDETRTSSLSLLSAMLWEPTKTLFANPLYLPNTDPQQTRARLKSMSTRSNITLPNERESWDLITPQIFQKLLLSHNNNKQQLSPRGPDWTNYLLKLTCCTNDKMQGMAIGAAQFLQEVLLVTNLCELKVQLEECWGIRVSEDIASSNENTTTRQARESCHAQNVTVAWARWLQVWDMIFRRGMVNRDHTTTTSTQAVDDVILDCIVLLVRGASDPFLRDESHTPFLQRVFSYLLGIVESKMKDLKLLVKELMDRLGTNWLDYGVGIMHLVTPVVVTGGPSQDLRFELCRALLESLLSPLDSTAVLKRWQWDDSSLPTRMMALSFVALQQVRPSVVQGGQEGPRCLAVIELALNLFQMALPQTRDVRYSLRGPLEEFGHVMQDLADKSNSWVLSDSHFLRFHYYLLCFKQVPRLEAPIAPRQSSIDSFFEAVK